MATRRNKAAQASSSHSAAANALLQKIRALRDEIPGFTQPQNARATQRLTLNASISDDFLESASVAIQSSVPLQSASGVEAEAVRETIRFSAAYSPVADELEALARAVRHTIAVRRAETAQQTLAAYDLAKGLARKPEGRDLVPHIADMRKTLNRGGSRRKPVKPKTP